MSVYSLTRGNTALLISLPHIGTELPEQASVIMCERAFELADTDWHLQQLYAFADALGANVLQARYSRYWIDLNRPANDRELYPGTKTSGLCPTATFSGEPLYRNGEGPQPSDVSQRLKNYWQPYHDALTQELNRLRRQHGVAVLFEAHSIRSRVPRLFEGKLAEYNIGTDGGRSCAASLQQLAVACLNNDSHYSLAVNQRFKGGYITRAYGDPDNHVHAIQLELSQATYMDEDPPFTYLPQRASLVQPSLIRLIESLLQWADRQ